MAKQNSRVAGHTLEREGAAHDDQGRLVYGSYVATSGAGRGMCSCGELSDVLLSGSARRRWHTNHKSNITGGPTMRTEDENGS